jgi:hypothetical protein
VIVAVPVAIIAVAAAAFIDLMRKRKGARTLQTHQPGEDVEFTERDRRTLVSE